MTIINPCGDPSLSWITQPASLDPQYSLSYHIGTPPIRHRAWEGIFTSKITQCGGVSFYAFDTDGTSLLDPTNLVAAGISWDPSFGLTVHSLDMTIHGLFKVQVKPYLTKYPNIQGYPVEMTIDFKACPVTRVDVPELGVYEIPPNGEEVNMVFEDFFIPEVEGCGYFWTYTALYEDTPIDKSAISDTIQFDTSGNRFTFSSREGDQSFDVIIRGLLSDGITVAQTNFTLQVTGNKAPIMKDLESVYTVDRTVDQFGKPFEKHSLILGSIADAEGDEIEVELVTKTEGQYFVLDESSIALNSKLRVVIVDEAKPGIYILMLKFRDLKFDGTTSLASSTFSVRIQDEVIYPAVE